MLGIAHCQDPSGEQHTHLSWGPSFCLFEACSCSTWALARDAYNNKCYAEASRPLTFFRHALPISRPSASPTHKKTNEGVSAIAWKDTKRSGRGRTRYHPIEHRQWRWRQWRWVQSSCPQGNPRLRVPTGRTCSPESAVQRCSSAPPQGLPAVRRRGLVTGQRSQSVTHRSEG